MTPGKRAAQKAQHIPLLAVKAASSGAAGSKILERSSCLRKCVFALFACLDMLSSNSLSSQVDTHPNT